MDTAKSKWITAKAAAAILGISPSAFSRYLANDPPANLRIIRLGRLRPKYHRTDVERLAAASSEHTHPPME